MEPEYFLSFLLDCIKSLNDNIVMAPEQELLTKLSDKKEQMQLLVKPYKKPQAPKPPLRFDDTSPNGVSPSFDLRPVVSQQHISEERESTQSPCKSGDSSLAKGKILLMFGKNTKLCEFGIISKPSRHDLFCHLP